ncbi:MAG: PAS domain S-box protein [Planctomycetes bacterium]|nr:PAS domain S-box protein [Planctomycetota bacterium]
MESALPASSRPMVVRSPDQGGSVRVNREFVERLGLTAEELRQQALIDWIHPEDRPALKQLLRAACGRASARHRALRGEWVRFDW